ncbi:uncharacterized protein LOC129580505 [Sitodiplosis mosellana]|uniref:uncharacterized protein LOC129580505 n=1 Tax=Sitodiplosis mosellana TaxID=263140 RepID=UPI002444E6C4|nr:uncharacterized protein LOC129580505 [Sitodiplosis mosellana]
MASKNHKATDFNDLCETSLLNVMEYLSVEELCVVKGVCRRLRKMASRTFERRYAGAVHFDDLMFNMPEIVRIIKCFGPIINSVTVNGSIAWELNTSILTMLTQKCSKLKKLKLICYHFDKPEMAIMKTLVQHLETIELLYCTIATKHGVNYNVFLKVADELRELVFIGRDQEVDLKFLNKKFSSMQKLTIISARLTDEEVLGHFLRKNRSIKHFNYMPNVPLSYGRSWTSSFDNIVPRLTDISIDLNKNIDYVYLFSSFTQLRRVVISCQGYSEPIHDVVSQLAKMNTLKVLGLWKFGFRELLTLPKVNNIETLELRKIKSLFDLKALSHELNKQWGHVKNLYLDHTAVRDANDIEVLVNSVMQVKNLFLCDLRGFFIMPTATKYYLWCSNRMMPLNIFVDSHYLMQHTVSDPNQTIVFQPFKDRICQMVNVICADHL